MDIGNLGNSQQGNPTTSSLLSELAAANAPANANSQIQYNLNQE
jgi:hypothetical protein